MDFNKVPRWMLIWGFMGFMSIAGIALKGAFADLDDTKARSLRTEQTVETLVETVKEIKINQETFRREYREDRGKDVDYLRDMEGRILRALKA